MPHRDFTHMKDIDCWQEKFEPCSYSDKLLGKLSELNNSAPHQVDITEVKKAIYYAKKYHGDQKRLSGEPYYSHPLEVAYMISDYLLKTDVIVASILHDIVEDSAVTTGIILDIFGPRVAEMVDRLTRDRPDGSKLSIEQILHNAYMHEDKEVLLIKIIDRLHNMETINIKSSKKIRKTVDETLMRFISLSIYLGVPRIEQILSELCIKSINLMNKQESSSNCLIPSLKQRSKISQIHNLLP